MGIFDTIKNVASSVLTAITPTKAKLQNVVDVLSIAINPLSKDKIIANVSNPTLKTAVETIANHPYVTAGVVAGGITAVSNPTAAVNATKSLIPTSTSGKIAAAVAIPIAAGVVAQSPTKVIPAVVSLPSELMKFGSDAAKVIENPTLQNAKNLIKESPVISAVVGAAAVGAVGLGVSGLIASVANTISTKENSAALMAAAGGTIINQSREDWEKEMNAEAAKYGNELPFPKTAENKAIAAPLPITPATQTVQAKSLTTTRKRAKRQIKTGNISQRVNILINSGKFINKRSLSY